MRTTPAILAARYRAEGTWSDTRLGDLYAAAASQAPERLALVDPPNRAALDGAEPRRLDWRSLSALIDATMVALAHAAVKRDDVLITQLPNVVEYIAVYIAAARLGVVVSPVPMQFRRNELEPIARLTRARALLTVRSFKGTEPARLANELEGPTVLVIGGDGPRGTYPFAPDAGADAAARAQQLEHAANVAADDVLTICWTSGTEGVPKGVPRSHNHWHAISCAHFDGAQLRRGDTLLNPFPLVNMAAIGGCFMSWLHAAGTLLLHHPFELPVYLRQIATERPQYAIAPPAVLNLLLQNEALLAGVDLTCLRCIGSGSAPLAPAMIRGYQQRFGIEVVNMFGSNEGVSLCSGPAETPEPERRARLFPRFGRTDVEWPQRISRRIETRIVDPQSGAEILDASRPGELQIRGPTVFDGYFAAPEQNAAAFTADGWFRTGDLFEIAEARDPRFYRFIGRLKQIINRGGMKISPDELDAVLAEHPDLAEAAVVGYPDDVLGERVCAVLVPKPGKSVSLESLQAHFAARQVAVYKWPERVRTVEQLPRNPVGKVLRAAIARVAAPEGSNRS
ncbi:MAG: class I adenylate-forming enzyme family protein [Gammaproteobacteria bacterium]